MEDLRGRRTEPEERGLRQLGFRRRTYVGNLAFLNDVPQYLFTQRKPATREQSMLANRGVLFGIESLDHLASEVGKMNERATRRNHGVTEAGD